MTTGVEYMTTTEVADLLRTPVETVRYWRHVGKGPDSIKVGRRVLYPRESVTQWLARLSEPSEAEKGEPLVLTFTAQGAAVLMTTTTTLNGERYRSERVYERVTVDMGKMTVVTYLGPSDLPLSWQDVGVSQVGFEP